jgi:uncharacterized repeat protein (TIGR03803 family)
MKKSFLAAVLATLNTMPQLGLAAPPERLTTLHAFSGADGSNPRAALLRGADGNFYGTTYRGGRGDGTVFKLTRTGRFATLHEFNGADGSLPSGSLVRRSAHPGHDGHGCDREDANEQAGPRTKSFREGHHHCDRDHGSFFGTTEGGGAGSAGTVFRITTRGVLTSLHDFRGSDGSAPSGLVRGDDGNFYGATQSGGPSQNGTIFKITAAGVLTTLHAFSGGDGAAPRAALAQGSDGNFYGTTEFGGSANSGTVFRITPAGVLATLHAFSFGEDGALPLAGLIQGRDGNFYGTTFQGARGYGTVFRMTPAGTLTTLHAFFPGDGEGSNPFAGLVQGKDGGYYGTTEEGGANGLGTVFRVTAEGEFTTLHAFDGSDGSNPEAGLTRADEDASYGTTANGGPHGGGVIFKIQSPHPAK